jgi:hypothetical protein
LLSSTVARLDEERRAARGGTVYDPRKLRSALRLDGHDGAVVSRSDQALLQALLVVARGERLIEELSQLGLEPSRALTDPLELATGVVPNGLVLGIDDSPNAGFELPEVGKALGAARQKRRLAPARKERAPRFVGDGARGREPQEALDSEDTALDPELLKIALDVGEAFEREPGVLLEEALRLARLVEAVADGFDVGGGPEGFGEDPALRGGGQPREDRAHLVEI